MKRPTRILLAWLDHDEAIALQLGHVPQPAEDVTHLERRWGEQKTALARRTAMVYCDSPILPIPATLTQLARDFQNRSDVQGLLSGLDWMVSYVDLTRILSFQKKIVLEGIEERTKALHSDDLESLFSFCLPTPDAPITLSGIADQDKKGVTLSSLNPNLRAIGYHIQDAELSTAPGQPSQRAKLVGFLINFGAPFLQVAEYRNRWLIRDGYHRAYALLRASITEVPCILVRAKSFLETGAEAPAFFRHEILYGDRPPFVKDFFDDFVSVMATEPVTRKIIRLKADEFFAEA